MTEDILSPDSITNDLGTRIIGKRVICYPSLASTNEVAKRAAQQKAEEGTVIVAGEQTAGKGRLKRPWLTPRGNIALSIIVYPSIASLPYIIMLSSLAVAHSIEAVTGLRPQLKWPNDVLIKGKKMCGILVESRVRRGVVDYAVIGIGINVNLRLSDFPEMRKTATSLSEELGEDVSCLNLIRSLLVEIDGLYSTLPQGNAIYGEWRDRLVTLGERVHVRSGENTYDGIAESVDGEGSLLLRSPDGTLTKIVAGDVTLSG
jgi:BirA family biotin operon repressor/biotin-[acetyl-CoA-carboxylase] ligase